MRLAGAPCSASRMVPARRGSAVARATWEVIGRPVRVARTAGITWVSRGFDKATPDPVRTERRYHCRPYPAHCSCRMPLSVYLAPGRRQDRVNGAAGARRISSGPWNTSSPRYGRCLFRCAVSGGKRGPFPRARRGPMARSSRKRANHDTVLVVPQNPLEPVSVTGDLAGAFSVDFGDGFGGVPQPFGVLADLVECGVPGSRRPWRVQRPCARGPGVWPSC